MPKEKFKKVIRKLIPSTIRTFLGRLVPKFHRINTFFLKNPAMIEDLIKIDVRFVVREIGWSDETMLRNIYSGKNADSIFKDKIARRLDSPDFAGLAVIDSEAERIVYLSWVILRSIPYFEEFGITLAEGDFLLKDIYVVPEYRHMGISSRMEQERINYCVQLGAKQLFLQPLASNKKGNDVYPKYGYVFLKSNLLIQWPLFNVWRELYSFLKNPFRKVMN